IAQRTAPVIDAILNQTIPEMTEKVFSVTAHDLDLPDDSLLDVLVSGPNGLTLDEVTGQVRWTPTEAQGPGVFPVTVRAIDRDGRSDVESFTITVTEVNRPPVLESIGNFGVIPGQSVSFTARAADPDLPANSLTYSVSGNVPPGFNFNVSTGQFNWTATAVNETTRYDFLVHVTDNGLPSLADSEPVTITVASTVIDLVEDDRFVTEYRIPVTIGTGIAQLQLSYDGLRFDRQDADSINDAFEVALVDANSRPVVGIITPNRDGFYNRTEEWTTLFGSGTTHTSDSDGDGGVISLDVSHLPAGYQATMVVRLVNNDSDNTTRVQIVPRVTQVPGPSTSASLATPSAWAASLNVLSRTYDDTDWRHLADVTASTSIIYDYTAYDIDSGHMGTGVTLRNTGNYPIRGPLLISVSGITSSDALLVGEAGQLPRDPGKFSDSTIASLAGSPFFDATQSLTSAASPNLTSAEPGSALLPGESVRLLLEFQNRSIARFDYQIHVMGTLNRTPEFDTQAPSAVRVGNVYRYDSGATDPDKDTLKYSLVSGPSGLTIDALTGMIVWTPTVDDVGTHAVTIDTVDPFGASDTQRFTIEVVDASAINRPPVFITDPIIDAYVGVNYQYASRAADPDFDALTYAMIVGPTGMSMLAGPSSPSNAVDPAGNLSWTPPAAAAGTYVPVTLQVEDGRGGSALQSFRIYVHPNPVNLPPVIVTTPQIDFDWAGPLGAASGVVTPQVIELDLGVGDQAEPPVTVRVPPQLPMVDVFLLFDDTGSFASRAPQLARAFPQVIDRLRQALPNVDLGFGVGRFEDYGGPAHYASSVDRPFVLNQPIFPASTVGMRDAIVQALSRRAPGGGGDGPESLIEALYQVATGLGFDGNNDGNALESGLAGMLRTQTAPGDSGDVPPFLPGNYDVFRAGAIPLPLNTTVNVPAINSNSTFAFKFTVQPGEAFQFQDSASSSDTSQWLVVNQIGRIVGVHRRGQTFIESFDTAEELLLIPRTQVGTTSAATMTRIPYQPPTEPLVFGQDNQFSFAADGERRRYTFTLTEPTAVIFDGIMADERTTWSLHDGTGNVFSSRIFGQPAHSDTVLDISPFEPGDPMAEGTVDQTHVLTAGNYVLTIRGLVSSTPTLFQATKFPPTGALPVVVGATISVPVQQERIRWVRVDGQTGQGFQVSHRPAVVLDADGLPLPRMQIMDEPSPDYGSLTFGQKPMFWLGLTSSRDETLTFTPSQTQSPASLPTATPVTLGTLTSGQLTATTQERHYEIVSDRWQWIKVAAARSSISWGLRSAGGAGWYEDPFSTSGAIPFLNQEVLLPPGVHRLTLKNAFFGFGTPTDFQFTVTARPFNVNNYTFETGPDNFAPFGPGARGGAGFRAGAIPIVLAATDTGTAYQPDGSSTVSGINNVQLPLNDLLSASRSETAGGRGASVQQAINALVQQGALVIGLGTNTDANVAPRKTLEAISKLTGATNAGTTALDSNISSDPIAQGDPLYFLINDNAVALANGVAAAIEAAVKSAPTNVNLRASDTTAGFTNRTGQKNGVRPDSIVQFETRFIGDGQAHVFDLQFIRPGSSEIIGSIPVAINDRYRYDSKAIDPDDDPVTLELIGENHGAQFDAAKGTIRWRPAAPGSYSFTLRASDPLGGEDIQSWTVTVGDLRTSNAEPVLAPLPPVVVSADTAMRLSAVATDQDAGDQLRYAFLGASVGSTTVPAGLTIDSATGQIDWIPTLTQVGQTRVIVRVTDARGGFDDQPLVIEVVPPAANNNRLPNITTQAIRNSVVDRHYLYDVDADDLDHDPLTYSLVIAPRGMVIDHTTGVVAWNPRQSDLGMHDVLLKVSDNMGGVVFQGYQLFVSQTNDPPEITSRPESVAAPGSAWNYQVLASDPNGDVLRYSLVSGQNPTGANIDASTGLLTWTPTATGAYRFSIEVSDGRGGRARQEFTLPVTDAAPPNIVSVPRGPARVGQLYEYLVVAVDPNANETVTLSLDATSIARGASLTATGCPAEHSNCAGAARLVWTPNSIGDFPIAITATDPTGNSVTQSFTLAVVQPPASSQPPVITSRPTGPALKNQLWSYAVTAVDPDGDPVTYRLGQAPAGMSIDRTTGLVNWTPGEVSSGVIVEVVAEDARGAWSMQAFDLPVVERINNAAPIFTSVPTGPGIVGQTWNYVASAFDPDGDIVSYELDAAALAAGLIISSSSGLITWTPRTSGQQTLIVTAKDAYGGVATQTITLPIQTPPNAPPLFISVPTGPALVGRAWLYAARATDPDGDTLRYSLSASTPATVTIDGSSGRVTFTPDSVGSVDITVFATDTAGNRAEQSFRLPTVAPPADGANRPPVFTSTPLGPARVDQA
ncbi:MAG: putative Ig domain-containing protein, partial [Pirellulaceae bacterium]|nr:putative Ig domain-containing protein [Pirellulaceae bacterium]